MDSPWTDYVKVEPELNQRLLQLFHGEKDVFIKVGPNKYFYPNSFIKDGSIYYNFQPRPTDIWTVAHPRTGTTLTQEIVWLLCNNFDSDAAAKTSILDRCPNLEQSSVTHPVLAEQILAAAGNDELKRNAMLKVIAGYVTQLNETTEKRIIKSHLPFSLLNPKLLTCGAKVIYIARNPTDVAESLYHLMRMFNLFDFVGNFDEFWNFFEGGNTFWGPIWPHMNEGWDLRHHPNVLFLFYEEFIKDMSKTIRRIADFLSISCNDEQVQKLVEHLDRAKFSNNKSVNVEEARDLGFGTDNKEERFIRAKKEDVYKGELKKRAEEWMKINFQKTTLKFPEI